VEIAERSVGILTQSAQRSRRHEEPSEWRGMSTALKGKSGRTAAALGKNIDLPKRKNSDCYRGCQDNL
jgi:hypothetical protein